MSYELEAVIVCDGCGNGMDHEESRSGSFATAKRELRRPRTINNRGTVETRGGQAHLCRTCKEQDHD